MSTDKTRVKSIKDVYHDRQKTELGQESRTGELVDSDVVVIKCSNCDEDLCAIKVTRPTAKIKSYIVVECPHCGDKSFKKEFLGSFCIGGTDKTSIINYPMDTSTEGDYFIQNIKINTRSKK